MTVTSISLSIGLLSRREERSVAIRGVAVHSVAKLFLWCTRLRPATHPASRQRRRPVQILEHEARVANHPKTNLAPRVDMRSHLLNSHQCAQRDSNPQPSDPKS